MERFKQNTTIFVFSGLIYCTIEILWRGYSHWSMALTGGLCFLILFNIYSRFSGLSLLKKCIIGAVVITSIEFIVGCIVNIWLKMNVWDYSNLPFNILGQVCLLYMFFWGILSIVIVYLSGKLQKFTLPVKEKANF